MKKLLLLIAILSEGLLIGNAQCPSTADVTLNSQDQIDNFIIQYPNCSVIEGYLIIEESNDGNITNLNGLRNIKYIGEGLRIQNNSALKSVAGLEALDSVGRGITINNNGALETLDGLSGIKKISDNLDICENNKLTSIKGFGDASLTIISGLLTLDSNPLLTSLSGLESIKTIKRTLAISNMDNLTNLQGLDNVISIGECLLIQYNYKLQNFTGLNKLDSVGWDMEVVLNKSLKNFSGLNSLSSIGSYVRVYANDSLLNFSGLGSLKVIGKVSDDLRNALWVYYNPSLVDFSGLEALNLINGDLNIDDNSSLLNLSGLQNLTALKGGIAIVRNDKLNDITGIENIDPETVKAKNSNYKDLQIYDNPQLSECAIQCICELVNDDSKNKNIQNNKTGCNGVYEIKAGCSATGIDDDEAEYSPDIFPNPAKNTLFLKYDKTEISPSGNFKIEIYSITGQKVISISQPVDKINISGLKAGIYLVNVITGKEMISRKIAVEK